MRHLVRDLRVGFRTFVRAPAFGLTVTVTLALGIGATTALFTVVHAVLINPLPFPDSRALTYVWRSELPALTYGSASYPRYLDWRREQRAFTDIGAYAARAFTVSAADGPERVNGAVVSASFFRVVGAPVAAGAWFSDQDDRAGGPPVVVISHAYWRRRFDSSPAAIGQPLTIDGRPFTIVGVAPAAYAEVWRPDVMLPVGQAAASPNRDNNFLLTVGRLKDGQTIDDARRALAELAAQMSRDNAIDKYGFTARPIHEVLTDTASTGLLVLLGASALLLLIACANVANLLLARSVERQRDVAIRASLGGTRGRLVGQITAESLALAAVASLAGAGVAWLIVRAFVTMAPVNFPRLETIALNAMALLFAVGIAIVTTLLAGLAPAFTLRRWDLNSLIRAGGGRGATSGRTRIASRALVVIEMSLALALVTAAGLLAVSVLRLERQDLGFTREPVLTFNIGLPPLTAPDPAAITRIHGEFLARARELASVTHVSAINMLPIARTGTNGPVRRGDDRDGKGVPVTEFRCVMDGYFDAMGIALLAGRPIDARDRSTTASVAVLNDTLAGRLFPGDEPARIIGRAINIGWLNNASTEVIGVVASVRSRRPDAPPDPEVYVPFTQAPTLAMSYVVRSAGNVSPLAAPLRTTLGSVVPDVPLSGVRTLDEIVGASTQLSRLVSWLAVVFGALAAVLAMLGVYSVLSYAVAQRMREFAIRAAIGAPRRRLVSLVLREGAVLSAIGIAGGLLIAWQFSALLGNLLFGIGAREPMVFAGAAAVLAFVAGAGYLIPAIRAARAEPMSVLRGE